MSLLAHLNEPQREAVTATDGPLLVLAGAGSGKTRVITCRIGYLLEHCQVPPQNILAVTFTNKAAEEMRQRVQALLGDRNSKPPWISTFHSLCVRLLRRDGPAAGIARDFTIYDDDDQLTLVKNQIKELGLDERALQPRSVLARISHAKNHGITPQAFYAGASDPRAEQVAVIYDRYQAALRRSNALDFDDLLLEAVRLLQSSPETAAKLGTDHLALTIPCGRYGVFRDLYLVHRKDGGGNPSTLLITDVPLLACVVLWAAATVILLYTPLGHL